MNLGLIGKSISHSFSKGYFEKKFVTESITGYSYTNFDLDDLGALSRIISDHHLSGLNVTKPYKEEVIPYLNELDFTAREIGAVNCIKILKKDTGPYLVGYNTDYYGFAQSIKPFLEPTHQKALILGTGGASKAVSFALKNIGVDVYYVTTGHKKTANYFHYSELNQYIMNAFKLIVNATPLGLFPDVNTCPEIPYAYILPQHLLYDLIYNPEETLFLKNGREKGAVTVNGLSMLKLQADKAWEIWRA
jgi:shikimate dehydrogenase